MKMSKSLGNTISPLDLMKEHGADILRLWALSVDFTEDHRIGKEILGGVADQYRKLRNTFRYLLGALDGFREDEKVGVEAMPELERYMLHLTAELDDEASPGGQRLRLQQLHAAAVGLRQQRPRRPSISISARTSSTARSMRRPASRPTSAAPTGRCSTCCSTRWCAGWRRCWCSRAEEVWGTRYPGRGSVHLLEWPEIPDVPADDGRWAELRELRDAGHRGDRAASPRQGRRVQPRSRGHGAGAARVARGAGRAVHRLVSEAGRCAHRGEDRQSQMRALLALSAGGRGRR